METIKQILMDRDGLTEKEAILRISEARGQLATYIAEDDFEDALHVCQEFFGLEPDYIDELLY